MIGRAGMKLYTMRLTKKSSERFFSLLTQSGIERLVDPRLHPGGQLAGFTKHWTGTQVVHLI